MQLEHTRYEVSAGIATVTLDRPQRMNAWTQAMCEELIALVQRADADDAVRVVVFTGSGRAYCAGKDLEDGGGAFDRGAEASLDSHRDPGGRLTLALHRARKPSIAAINGAAVGIGITMTLAMNLRVVAEDAKVGFVFTRRGIVPEACSTFFLPRLVGMGKAQEWMLTGRVFRARQEAGSGLFNYVLPAAEVLPKALALAEEIATHTSAVSVGLTSALLWDGIGQPTPESTHLLDSRCMFWCGQGADAHEGVESFLEKRPARFPLSVARDMPDFFPFEAWRRSRA